MLFISHSNGVIIVLNIVTNLTRPQYQKFIKLIRIYCSHRHIFNIHIEIIFLRTLCGKY